VIRDYLKQGIRWIARLEDTLLALLLLIMILIAGSQILLRNLFDSGFVWADPMLRVLVLWLGLLGAMVATRDDNHIRIDILSRYLSPRFKSAAQLVTSLFTSVVSAIIAYHAGRFVYMEWQDGSVLFAGVPAWACEIIIPIGFGMIALRYLMFTLAGAIKFVRVAP
jgi:TRAP-type C4-dicarboxylate transport system permease small subunit